MFRLVLVMRKIEKNAYQWYNRSILDLIFCTSNFL